MLRRGVMVGVAALMMASCTSGEKKGSAPPTFPLYETTTTAPLLTEPVVASVLSPAKASVQGRGGLGMVVVLTFTARDPNVVPAALRADGALSTATAALKPGANPAFPGLVVGLSTTGAALGGPSANLANLFQTVSPAKQLDGSMLVSVVWTNGQADFGSDTDATLVAFVVSGAAPDVIPPSQANLDVISNPVEVTFRVSPTSDASASTATQTTTTAPTATDQTTTSVRPTTSTTKPPVTGATTATTRPATTTTRPTTSTTLFLGLIPLP